MKPYYERGGIQIFHASCLDVLPQLDSVDHVITDPPYEAEAHTKARRIRTGTAPGKAVRSWEDAKSSFRTAELNFAPISECLREAAAFEIARLAKRWALVFCQAEAAHKWEDALIHAGHNHRRWCVWVKPDGQPQFTGDRPGMGYETIVATHAPGRSTWNGGGKVGVFTFVKNVTGSQRAAYHQAEKPIALMRQLVSLFTDPGETILDPFGGSMTTALACQMLGRKSICIELEEKYCEIGAKRLAQMPMALPVAETVSYEQAGLAL